ECCSGGHNPPLICSRHGSVRTIDAPSGVAVGVMDDSSFSAQRLVLQPGDLLLLYTDGVTEAMNPQHKLFSDQRLRDTLGSLWDKDPIALVGGLRRDVAGFAQGEPQSDDITLLALRYKGPESRNRQVP